MPYGTSVPNPFSSCSNVTSLPDQAADAALMFEPRDCAGMAAAIARLWSDEALRATLVERGSIRVKAFTWDRTARHFRAHYRRLGRRDLDDADRTILASPPIL